MVGAADSFLIREVPLIQSVLYRVVHLLQLYIRTYVGTLVTPHHLLLPLPRPHTSPSLPLRQVHWFAICNSVAIVLFLSGILALILVRTLRRDIARYNRISDDTDFVSWHMDCITGR